MLVAKGMLNHMLWIHESNISSALAMDLHNDQGPISSHSVPQLYPTVPEDYPQLRQGGFRAVRRPAHGVSPCGHHEWLGDTRCLAAISVLKSNARGSLCGPWVDDSGAIESRLPHVPAE